MNPSVSPGVAPTASRAQAGQLHRDATEAPPGFAGAFRCGYSTSVPAKLPSKNAALEYERRFNRDWRADAYPGFRAATCVEFSRRLLHRLETHRRIPSKAERRLDPLPPVPDWLKVGIAHITQVVRADPSPERFGMWERLIAESNSVALITQNETLPAEMTLLTTLIPDLVKAAAKRTQTGAALDFLQAFYAVTRAVLLHHHDEKPTPAAMALLSGAVGIEQYDRIGPTTKKWESRIRRWREMPGFDDEYAKLITLHSPNSEK